MAGERERVQGNGNEREDASERAYRPLVPVGIPTGTKGSFRYRVIYPVTKGDTFGTTLRAPVGEPGLKLVFNRYLKLFL